MTVVAGKIHLLRGFCKWKGDVDMRGIFHKGHWYENTGMICKRCRNLVYKSDNPEYSYQCFHCDEDLYSFEATERDTHYLPKVMVARPVGGITINEELEYLLNADKTVRIFNNQPEAEAYLLENGFNSEALEFLYFVEVQNDEI